MVASLLLILVAVVLLVAGLAGGSSLLLVGSVAASLLAAVVLVVAAGQLPARRRADDPGRGSFVDDPDTGHRRPAAGDHFDDPDSDEPGAQRVSAADAARVALMVTTVSVVDGRPRYHLPQCPSLLGRQSESLPVREALELGFTPCARCEPDSTLLAAVRHG